MAKPAADDVYSSSSYAESSEDYINNLIRSHPLATVVAVSSGKAYAASVPLVIEAGRTSSGSWALVGHMARNNPHWQRCLTAGEVLILFQGPGAYITPSWYPEKREHGRVVPTWNYSAVHIRGQFELVAPSALQEQGSTIPARRVLDVLTEHNEKSRAKPWSVADAPPAYIAAQMRAIVCFRVVVSSVSAVRKMSQNKTASVMQCLSTGLRADFASMSSSLTAANAKATADDMDTVGSLSKL